MADAGPPTPIPTQPTTQTQGVGGGLPYGYGGAGGSLGGDAIGSTSSSSSGGNMQNLDAAGGIVPLQGTGATPQYNQGNAAVGGNQTAGFQYGMGDVGNVDQSKVDPAQMGYMNVDNGENYQAKMQDAYYNQATSRLDPQWNQRQGDMENQLQNMGLTRGSEAWNRESQNFGQQRNDAYNTAQNQAIMNSGAEAQRRQNMDIAQGDFGNKNIQQNFENQLTSQQSQNAAQNQNYNQRLGGANLNNQAITAQQGAAQGWKNIESNLEASKYGADRGYQSAGLAAGASTSNAQLQASLLQRQIQNQERGQDFDMYWGAKNNAIDYQNKMYTGMNPGNPAFGTNPAVAGEAGYAQGMQTGNNQINSGISNAAGAAGNIKWPSLGGNAVGAQPDYSRGGGYGLEY
jgi:hypothetical protein